MTQQELERKLELLNDAEATLIDINNKCQAIRKELHKGMTSPYFFDTKYINEKLEKIRRLCVIIESDTNHARSLGVVTQ